MDIYDPFANLVSRGISRAQAPFYITSHWVDLVDFFLGGLSEPLFLTSLSFFLFYWAPNPNLTFRLSLSPDQPFRHQLNYLTPTTSYISCPFEQLFESTLVVSDLDDGSSKLTRSYVPNLTSVVSDVNSPYKPGFMTMVKSFLNFCSSSDSSFESHNLLSIRPIFSFLDSYSKIFK